LAGNDRAPAPMVRVLALIGAEILFMLLVA
jgi:hypothetical protein